jgi:hypothetical protein
MVSFHLSRRPLSTPRLAWRIPNGDLCESQSILAVLRPVEVTRDAAMS